MIGIENSVCREGYCEYLKGLYWGILKDCEKKRDYTKLIDAVSVELLAAIVEDNGKYDCINVHKLYALTASLRYTKYPVFRETILFKCMPLVESIFKED